MYNKTIAGEGIKDTNDCNTCPDIIGANIRADSAGDLVDSLNIEVEELKEENNILKSIILLTHNELKNVEVNDLTIIQWNIYVDWFRENRDEFYLLKK